MQHRLVYVSIIVVLCILGASACTMNADIAATPAVATSRLSGRITFAGSTTVQPLAAQMGEGFKVTNPDVILDIAAGGSSVGIKAIHDGTVDIGMASRDLSDDEAVGVTVHQIAVDVIAIVVNAENPVEGISLAELQAIYNGEITNWREIGGNDEEIIVGIRESTSGTRGAFDEIVLDGEDPLASNAQKTVTAGDMAALVIHTENAIGYVGFGNIETGLKTITIDGAEPSEENARNGSYTLKRPLLLITGPLTQPLADEFIAYALSPEGQQLVIDSGWVPVK